MRASTGITKVQVAWKARNAGIGVVRSSPGPQLIRNHKCLLHRTCISALRPDQSRPDVQTTLLSSLTTIGLLGTIAVTGASLCGFQVFSLFHWDQDEIIYAFGATIPLLLVELLLFAPIWSIPTELLDEHSVAKQAIAYNTAQDAMQGADQPQPVQLVDVTAVRQCSLWSLQNWQLMLALYKSVLQQLPTEQVPKMVRIYCSWVGGVARGAGGVTRGHDFAQPLTESE